MIYQTINTITAKLNAFALKKTGAPALFITHGLNDTLVPPEDKVLVTLAAIEEDRISANRDYYNHDEKKYLAPEVKVNLVLLFSTSHKEYDEKLKALSIVLTFFQTTPFLENAAEGIKRLTFELQTLSFEHQSYIWGLFNMKYSPSVVYRVRVVALQDREILGEGQPITRIEIAAH